MELLRVASSVDALVGRLFTPTVPDQPGKGLLSPDDWRQVRARFGLTERELSVAILIFEGETRSQVARQLQCAPGTVRVYIDRLFDKLHVNDRLGMALRVMRSHLSLVPPKTECASHKSAS